MPVAYTAARTALAPYVDNGVAATDTTRIDQRIDEAQRRLVDHYNFISRREESARTPLVWQAGGTTGNPATGNLIADNLDATKNMVLALWREENNQLDLATNLETKAYSYIERNITNEVERERRTAFETLAATSQNTFGGLTGRLGLETLIQYRLPESRIKSFINQAYQQAIDHHNFVIRREDKSRTPLTFTALSVNSDAFNALLPVEVVRLLALALIITDSGADGTGLKQQALELIDRNVTALVEQTRRDAAGEEGRLHNELPEGVKVPTARMTQYLSQAATDASVQWDFLARREDYSSGSKPSPFPFEVRKKLVESYIATANAAVDVATALKQEAFAIVERDLMTQVEAARRATGGEAGQLHNELPDGVRVSTTRMNTYLNQAATEAGVHWDFLARREDYSSGTKPNPFSYEVRKLLVESYLATANAAVEVASAKKQAALAAIERDLMAQVEAARRSYTSVPEVGQLHNELPDGVKVSTARMTTYLAQAATEAGAHWDFLARREDYSSGTKPNPFSYEVRKKLVESYLASSSGAIEVAAALKAEAQALIERDLMTQVEAARRAAASDEGKLHNELPNGVTIPTARLTTYLAQATTEVGTQQAFVQRREEYNGTIPSPSYEQKKLLVESYIATSAGQPDVAAALKQQALALVERDVMTEIENTRRSTRTALLANAVDTFGYHWGRIGLELPEAYKLSDSAVKRMVNSAEEQLMLAGKWVGTVGQYTISVSTTGEFFLPAEVETILYMSFDGDPKPVHDRLNEWIKGGTGYRETDDAWREGAVDRGEAVDPSDNVLKRKYWITLPTQVPVVRILGKRRFVPHTGNSEKMYLRNYQAIYEATKGILLGGDQITPHMEKAKEMLATQIAQQNFQGNRGAAHTRRIYQFR